MSRWSARARTPNEGREGGREGFVEWEREERSMAGREGGREGGDCRMGEGGEQHVREWRYGE